MNKLLLIFIPSLFIILFGEKYKILVHDKYGNKKVLKYNIFFITVCILMVVFIGLRTWYNDTVTYMQGYNMLNITKSIFSTINLSLGENPGFWILNEVIKRIGFSAQSFIMFYAAITIPVYLWFIKKYSSNLLLSFYLFYTIGCYVFAMAAIKQCVAVAFCLIATDRAINKKWKSYYFWVIFACTFHVYAFLYLIVPLLNFKPWSKKTFQMLLFFGVISIFFPLLMNSIIGFTSSLGEEYDTTLLAGQGVNIYRLAVSWAPVILSHFYRDKIENTNSNNIIINLAILNAEVMFIALFGTANYFARLANYFLIFQTLLIPIILMKIGSNDKKWLILFIVICYFLYFYYSNVISQPFDSQFQKINFFNYIESLFKV